MDARKTRDEYRINNTYETQGVQELSVDWNGYNFLIIYGEHINGWFIAVPNWKVCVEAATPEDVFYNTEKLGREIGAGKAASVISEAVKKHWESGHADM